MHEGDTAMSMERADGGSDGTVGRTAKKPLQAEVLEPFYCGGNHLEEGAYGSTVYFCTQRRNKFAAKVMSLSIYSDLRDEEANERCHIDPDRCIVKYFDIFQDARNAIIITELCGGDVDQLIQCKKNRREMEILSEEAQPPIDHKTGTFLQQTGYLQHFDIKITDIMRHAVEGINYLHSYQPVIVHGDIKPSNFLLLKHDVYGTQVKVTDYGFNRASHSETITAGTPSFMVPEYCVEPGEKVKKTREADIFSLGLTLFYIFTEGFHVYGDHPYERLSKIWRRETPAFNDGLPRGRVRSYVMEGVTDEHRITTCDMIRRMLKHKPSQRHNIHQVAKHPTFWDSRTKVKFYKDTYKKFEEWHKSNQRDRLQILDCYDAKLGNDEDSGSPKFDINEESFPKVCRGKNTSSVPVKFEPKGRLVYQLVKAIRNKSSHGDLTSKERKELGLEKDDWDKFLHEFTGTVPQLLVHLYEKFRDVHVQDNDTYY